MSLSCCHHCRHRFDPQMGIHFCLVSSSYSADKWSLLVAIALSLHITYVAQCQLVICHQSSITMSTKFGVSSKIMRFLAYILYTGASGYQQHISAKLLTHIVPPVTA